MFSFCSKGDAPGLVPALLTALYLGQDLVTTHQPGPHTSLETVTDIDANSKTYSNGLFLLHGI